MAYEEEDTYLSIKAFNGRELHRELQDARMPCEEEDACMT
jgi:hypothetical protein